ncbi:oligoribonuclease [Rathayibacter sp. VKM Ac-2857]|uniref:oligoribonuclease n=1 Tax=Rathayibacter sp. VKM Ac-2857 TaxID=2739020 RepID=UPI001564E7CD|nr:oligoribonuclease [Rathayibacter sp. VKM Ac-2857]NQX16809.1 oligoribonuclease [Rathayibacter sp. VKM Ac-2857]
MSNDIRELSEGESYLAFFQGGPFDGQTETRVSTEGGYEKSVDVYAAVDGQETHLVYTSVSAKEVGESVHVTYALDTPDSDPVEDPEDRGGGFQ